MEWRDEGAVLTVRRHGESAAIVELFTAHHGRHAGVVRGGGGRRMAPVLQPGAQLDVVWRARLDAQIGSFTVEPLRARDRLMARRGALAALNAVCAMLSRALPERQPHPGLYAATIALLDGLEAGDRPADYLQWELRLLEDLGFGLDLSACAVTGATADLRYVSPRTGRAVSAAGAGRWAERLLPLPACLLGGPDDPRGIAAGLRLTGHFLARELGQTRPLPEARARLVALLGGDGPVAPPGA
jgi:DNA repair protein RecO (recombination protein O)